MPRKRSNGDGSIFADGDGWRIQLMVEGKLVRRRATTKAQALAMLKELRQQVEAGLTIGTARQTVAEWLEHWLGVIAPKIKVKTLEGYRAVIGWYILPHLGHIRLEKLTAQQIENGYANRPSPPRFGCRPKPKRGNVAFFSARN